MKKTTYLKQIQSLLPKEIFLSVRTKVEFTTNEMEAISDYIIKFSQHYAEHGKTKNMLESYPTVSKRISFDFGMYRIKSDVHGEVGKHVIYLNEVTTNKAKR
jgi:hypothetical protein